MRDRNNPPVNSLSLSPSQALELVENFCRPTLASRLVNSAHYRPQAEYL